VLTLIIATFGTKRAHFGHSDKKVGVCNCLSWMNYVTDTEIADTTPPASPSEPDVKGSEITWTADADLESGIAYFVIERDGKVLAQVALPVAGLISDLRATAVAKETTKLKKAWVAVGCTLPYMGFNLIPLSVIPEIRITDRGLVTVPGMQQLPLFEKA
jgi:hypothetical protein